MKMSKQQSLPKLNLWIIICSCITWFILCITLPFYALTAVLCRWLPARVRHRMMITWGWLFTFLTRYICRITYSVTGLENLPKTSSILASNHQSTWETFAFSTFLPQHVWILKRELTRIPLFGVSLKAASPIAINRGHGKAALEQIAEQSIERIKCGFWILVFPEGTRVTPHTQKAYKTGIAKMALLLDVPIVPIAHNAGYVMPKRSFWIYPGHVTIRIGKTIDPEPEKNSPVQLTAIIKDSIMHELDLVYSEALEKINK